MLTRKASEPMLAMRAGGGYKQVISKPKLHVAIKELRIEKRFLKRTYIISYF